MKVIISHDVDYITVYEHKDLSIPKHIIRTIVESSVLRTIRAREVIYRVKQFLINRWHNIPELLEFDLKNNIPATFFFGVRKALGMCYKQKDAKKWIGFIQKRGFKVNLHAVEYKKIAEMKKERKEFIKIFGIKPTGVRIHYLRIYPQTLDYLNRLGYKYDSSTKVLKNPYKVGNMWEFPITIMDTGIFNENNYWQVNTFKQAKEKTLRILERAKRKKLKFITVLFHDNRFCDGYIDAKEWYIWLITYLKSQRYEFVDFEKAIEELEKGEKNQRWYLL